MWDVRWWTTRTNYARRRIYANAAPAGVWTPIVRSEKPHRSRAHGKYFCAPISGTHTLPYRTDMNTRTICRALVALAFLLVTETRAYTPVSKEQQRILLPSSTRIVTSLAGPWERSVDDGDWTPVYLPRSESFDGRISYRRSFTVDDQAARSMSWNLSFLGLADAAEVTINDRYVGKFFGGMTPFMAHIPDKIIKAGTNTIRLVVYPASDNAVRARKQQLFGQRIATGVVRELFLVGTPQISLGDVRTTIEQTGSGARVTARTTAQVGSSDKVILGDSAQSGMSVGSVTVTAQLRSPNDGIVISSGQQQLRVMKDRVMDLQFDLQIGRAHV